MRSKTKKAEEIALPHFHIGRNGWIRTTDLCDPNAAFYQAELRSVRQRIHIYTKKI